ncbi:hypothetical protein ACUN8C_01640 [Kushneria sp. Sum13]|uniref:hypothetical protein n=1 Tax=Kushneria sp. Sum13 TaxID=3459196 RepID=UPI004045EC15
MTKLKKITRIIGAVSEPALKGVAGPLLAPVWDTVKAFNDAAIDQISQNREKRLDRFHRALVKGVPPNKAAMLLHSNDTDYGSYESLLNACWQDIEESKTELYARLASKVLADELRSDFRLSFIMFLRDLSSDECAFLKTLYISGKYDFLPNSSSGNQLRNLVSSQNPIEKLALKKFESYYLFDSSESNVTHFGESFLQSIYSSQELTPQAIGKKHYKGHTARVFCDFNDLIAQQYSNAVCHHLFEKNFSCSVVDIYEGSFRNSFSHDIVILVVGRNTNIKKLELFNSNKKRRNTHSIKFNFLVSNNNSDNVTFEFDQVHNVRSIDELKECLDSISQ